MVRTRGGKTNWVESPDAGVTLGDDALQVKEERETAAMVMVAAAAAPPAPSVEIAVEFDKSLLDCPLRSLPLKPPVFQCPAKHTACGPCAANQANKCPACDGAYERDEGADHYLVAVRVPCPNQAYGCGSSVVYCMAGDHRLVCPHAPCRCPEPGCGFLGPPHALRVHLDERHAWSVTDIAYCSVLEVQMHPAEQGRQLLSAEDGERLFLLVASERGVKVVRASAAAEEEGSAWYRCKVWMHAPVDTDTGHTDVLMLDAKVESCAVPSVETAMGAGGRYLPVPSDVLAPEGGGTVLRLRIDKEVKASRSPRSRG